MGDSAAQNRTRDIEVVDNEVDDMAIDAGVNKRAAMGSDYSGRDDNPDDTA